MTMSVGGSPFAFAGRIPGSSPTLAAAPSLRSPLESTDSVHFGGGKKPTPTNASEKSKPKLKSHKKQQASLALTGEIPIINLNKNKVVKPKKKDEHANHSMQKRVNDLENRFKKLEELSKAPPPQDDMQSQNKRKEFSAKTAEELTNIAVNFAAKVAGYISPEKK